MCAVLRCYSGHIRDSAVGTPVFGFTPDALSHSLIVVAFPSRLSLKSAPSISAPSNKALIRFAFVKSVIDVMSVPCTQLRDKYPLHFKSKMRAPTCISKVGLLKFRVGGHHINHGSTLEVRSDELLHQ